MHGRIWKCIWIFLKHFVKCKNLEETKRSQNEILETKWRQQAKFKWAISSNFLKSYEKANFCEIMGQIPDSDFRPLPVLFRRPKMTSGNRIWGANSCIERPVFVYKPFFHTQHSMDPANGPRMVHVLGHERRLRWYMDVWEVFLLVPQRPHRERLEGEVAALSLQVDASVEGRREIHRGSNLRLQNRKSVSLQQRRLSLRLISPWNVSFGMSSFKTNALYGYNLFWSGIFLV